MPASIRHLVWAGGSGGAERQLLLWLENHPEQGGYCFHGADGKLLRGGKGLARGLLDLLRWGWMNPKPSLHCWMYRAAIVGAFLRIATLFRLEVAFEIRHGLGGDIKPTRKAVVTFVGAISRLLRIRCTFNSYAAMSNHMRFGYVEDLGDVRWNLGRRLIKDHLAGAKLRARLGIPSDAWLICSIGRDAPEKNFDASVAAFRELAREGRLMYLLVGSGCSRFHDPPQILGIDHLDSIVDVYSTADLVFIPSRVESLSNVLCEAIDCGCNIASTRAGDAAPYAQAKGYENIEFGDPSPPELRRLLERAIERLPNFTKPLPEQKGFFETNPR